MNFTPAAILQQDTLDTLNDSRVLSSYDEIDVLEKFSFRISKRIKAKYSKASTRSRWFAYGNHPIYSELSTPKFCGMSCSLQPFSHVDAGNRVLVILAIRK